MQVPCYINQTKLTSELNLQRNYFAFVEWNLRSKSKCFTKFCTGLHEVFGFNWFNLWSFDICSNVIKFILFWQNIKIRNLCKTARTTWKNWQPSQTPWRGAQCSCIGCIGFRPALLAGITSRADSKALVSQRLSPFFRLVWWNVTVFNRLWAATYKFFSSFREPYTSYFFTLIETYTSVLFNLFLLWCTLKDVLTSSCNLFT